MKNPHFFRRQALVESTFYATLS